MCTHDRYAQLFLLSRYCKDDEMYGDEYVLNCCCQANCELSTANDKHKVLAKHVFNSACY